MALQSSRLRPYRPGTRPANPASLPVHVNDELTRVGVTIDALLSVIKDLEGRIGTPTEPAEPTVPTAPKGWRAAVSCMADGTILSSTNVKSVVLTNGVYRITFNDPAPDVHYAFFATARFTPYDGDSNFPVAGLYRNGEKAPSHVDVNFSENITVNRLAIPFDMVFVHTKDF